ncbi:hypothetical protein PO909_024823 [Leuciscus waleckii]
MRSEALLSLLFILALSDRADCQNQYDRFKRRHILPNKFNTRNMNPWVNHLMNNNLCGQTMSSFVPSNQENNIIEICRGAGIRQQGNLFISIRHFPVYIVTSHREQQMCVINECTVGDYIVIVACDGDLPAHYHGQEDEIGQIVHCY